MEKQKRLNHLNQSVVQPENTKAIRITYPPERKRTPLFLLHTFLWLKDRAL